MPGKVWRRKSTLRCQTLRGENGRFTVASIKISCCHLRPLQMDLWQDCICTNLATRRKAAALPKRDWCWWWRRDLHRSRLGGSACLAEVSSALPTQPSPAHFPKLNFWLLSLKNIFSGREREKGGQLCQRMFCLSPLGLGYGFNTRFP